MSAPAELVRPQIDDLMARSIVWDNHGCMPLRWRDQDFLPQLRRYRDAGVDAVTLNIGFGENSIEEHVRVLAAMRRWLMAHPEDYLLAGSVADIGRAKAEGRLAVLFDIEGMGAVDDQPSLVRLYYDLGVRWMLVAYNRNNKAGGGCQDEDCGLTPLGEAILDEMAGCGMLACCSHTGYRTARQVIDRSPNPVIFSHSNPRAVWDHYRNVPDELFKACAARGGVIGLNGIGLFLGDCSTETFVRHLDHVAQLVGPEHVALGLDYVFDTSEFDELIAKMPETFPQSSAIGPACRCRWSSPSASRRLARPCSTAAMARRRWPASWAATCSGWPGRSGSRPQPARKGASAAREFVLMQEAGLTPVDALKSATTNAADIIAVPADPVADLHVMRKVGFVMKGGKVFKPWTAPAR